MGQVRLVLFGAPRIYENGQPVEINLHKAVALLVYLAVTKQAHSRDALAALFWPESDQSTSRANLRRTLYRINMAFREDVLVASPDMIGPNPRLELLLDIEQYWKITKECLVADNPADHPPQECLVKLSEAVKLYTNDFLAGFTLPDAPAFDEWQFFEAESLRQSLIQVLQKLGRVHQERGEFEEAISYLRRRISLDPLHETSHRQLMQLYALSGHQAAALRQYKECVHILKEELGTPPQQETIDLYEKIRLGRETPVLLKIQPIPETRYLWSEDVHIAYQILGQGRLDLIFVNGFISHLEQIWEEPGLAQFFKRLASFSRLILFDKRGVGLSDRVGYPPSLENTMQDIRALMNAAGSEKAFLMGVSEGGPNSLLFAATYPELVSGLIVYGSIVKGTRSEDYPWGLTQEQHTRWMELLMVNWGKALDLELFAPSRTNDQQMRQWWAKSLRLASSPGEVKAVLEVMRDIDIRNTLPAIHVPTLILHRIGDRAIRIESGRYLASHIPGAKLIELPGEDHWYWIGESERILSEIKKFLEYVRSQARIPGSLPSKYRKK